MRTLTASQKKIITRHGKLPTTRRDFMALGLLGSASFVLSQSFWSRLAMAQVASIETLPSFMVFDLVGGAALPGNFLVGKQGGSTDLLSSYSTLGFDPKKVPMDDRFGLPSPRNISQMFVGMINTISPEAQSNLKLTSIAHQSVDDSNNNTTSALGLVAKLWENENILKQKGFSLEGTSSGGRTQLSLDLPSLRPEQLTSLSQLNLLKGLGFLSNGGIKNASIQKIVGLQKDLYSEQFKQMSSEDQKNYSDAFSQQMDLFKNSISGDSELDPRNIESVRSIFNLNQNTNENDQNAIIAGVIHTSLVGKCGPSCIALDGYDYHDSTQTTGDQRDLIAGQTIGRSVELAHRLQKPFFFQILTDGGCSSSTNGREWVSDSGDRGLTVFGYYNPQGVKQTKTQIGHYTDGQIAETDTYVGRRTSNAAEAVFINYLSANNLLGKLQSVITKDTPNTNTVDSLISIIT